MSSFLHSATYSSSSLLTYLPQVSFPLCLNLMQAVLLVLHMLVDTLRGAGIGVVGWLQAILLAVLAVDRAASGELEHINKLAMQVATELIHPLLTTDSVLNTFMVSPLPAELLPRQTFRREQSSWCELHYDTAGLACSRTLCQCLFRGPLKAGGVADLVGLVDKTKVTDTIWLCCRHTKNFSETMSLFVLSSSTEGCPHATAARRNHGHIRQDTLACCLS
jgi:hypothetical protein